MLLRLFPIIAILVAPSLFAQVEPDAGTWRTWVLPSAAQVRLPPPPGARKSAGEIQVVKALMAQSNAQVQAQIAYWDSGSPGYRWIQLAAQQLAARNVPPTMLTRGLALVSVAIYDATIAAWDSRYAYNRPHPAIRPLVKVPRSPSYPSEHAVAAGAASAVLGYLFPDMADMYANLAEQAGGSRLFAGAAFPSDVSAGLELGRAIGQMVVTWGQGDGSATLFTGAFAPAPGLWSSPNPVTPLAGSWKPWVLRAGSEFRLPAPPPADSPDFQNEVAAVKNFARTNATNHSAWFWQPSFAAPWLDSLNREIFENHLDANPPRAARAYALETIAQHDATLACWDTKYTWLEQRPAMADPSIIPLFANPQHPGFPSGHACASGASSAVMSYLFPNDAQSFAAMALDAGSSTFDAAIHTNFDVQQGLALGVTVGQEAVKRAQTDGSQ